MTTALTMFIKASIRDRGIPFDVVSKMPNAETIEAIEEGIKIARAPNVKAYDNMEELIKDLES